MKVLLSFAGRRIIPRSRSNATSTGKPVMDRDTYDIKYPGLALVACGLACWLHLWNGAYTLRRNLEEVEVVRTPLSERLREPNMKDLKSHHQWNH